MNAVSSEYRAVKTLQHEPEFVKFLDIVKREGVRSYLEIGCKYGGTLWGVANALPSGSKVVAVDLPWGKRETEPHLIGCVNELRKLGYDASLFLTDSTDPQTVAAVANHAPFDLLFIDANHTLPFVQKDWANYGPLARIVVFHDIAWKRPRDWKGGYRIDVPEFWNSIKGNFRHEEIKLDPTGQDNGIGILWRT